MHIMDIGAEELNCSEKLHERLDYDALESVFHMSSGQSRSIDIDTAVYQRIVYRVTYRSKSDDIEVAKSTIKKV